jgi:hypothetical protein
MKFERIIVVIALIVCVVVGSFVVPSRAWSPNGHTVITTEACKFLPSPWKEFFQYYGWLLNETSLYPDSYRESDPNEGPRHYVDLEIWDPNKPETGTLSQAVEEFTTKMEQSIRAGDWNEMFLHAGRIAHYVADVAQPYHTTVNYDPLTPNGTALHQVLDSSIGNHMSEIRLLSPSRAKPLTPIANMTKFVLDMAIQSHSFLPAINETLIDKGLTWSPELTRIVENRTNTAVVAVARVWYTAIERSKSLPPDLPQINKLSVIVENMTFNRNDLSIIRLHVVDSLGVRTYADVVLKIGDTSFRAQVANVVPPLGEYVIILGPGIYEGSLVFVAEREGYSSGTSVATVTRFAEMTHSSGTTSFAVAVRGQNPYLWIVVIALFVLFADVIFVLWYYRRFRGS